MRRFNPEKELRKIQKGNKNKVIISVCLLLLIIAIGSSYALYQIRYSKQIIYTTVAPFNKKDIILSVKLDDQEKSTDKFPEKEEGYVYSHIECENGNITNESWDNADWNLTASIKGPDKCTVFFVKSPFHMKSCENKTMSECLLEEGQKFENILAFDDPDQNGRYIGANPNNYIWFNCDDYDNLTQTTAAQKCEKWRIIGLMNNITKVSGGQENLVKIIRADNVGIARWDTAGKNNWATASLQKALNEAYLTATDTGTWIGGEKDPKYKPITAISLWMIENIVLNIGGVTDQSFTAQQVYGEERESNVPDGAPATLGGRVGLLYPSDYGYATTGNNDGKNRTDCLKIGLFDYGKESNNNSYCYEKDWLSYAIGWFLTPRPFSTTATYLLDGAGRFNYHLPIQVYAVHPVIYLKSSVKVLDGTGTSTEPYILA